MMKSIWLPIFFGCVITRLAQAQRYDVVDHSLVEERQLQLTSAADDCVSKLGTSLGEDFLECVINSLETRREFPLPPYTLHPLTFKHDKKRNGLMLLDLLRNYTCGRTQDGGSPSIAKDTWIYDEKTESAKQFTQTCPSNLEDNNMEDTFISKTGYLPDGDHLTQRRMTVENAKNYCEKWPECQGFTFALEEGEQEEEGKHSIFFKSKADKVQFSRNWRTYVRSSNYIPKNCLQSPQEKEDENREYHPPQQFTVEIIRREPLVARIPNFASSEECRQLIEAGGSFDDFQRAQETGQGATSYRRSYARNIDVDYHDQAADITRFAERMFAFVRNVTNYQVYGPGQEPINAVLYKNPGDEYRPHCDGLCAGQSYPYGQRVATSILYCQVPSQEHGGQTSFTRSGLMVAPQVGDFLLFAYKYPNGTMDNGFTEHSGCKISGGRKWIATQWYREGVDYNQPWDYDYEHEI